MPGVTYFIPSYSTRNRVVHLSLARSSADLDLLLEAATVTRVSCFLLPDDAVIWLSVVHFTSVE
jgi:hypothetical protein